MTNKVVTHYFTFGFDHYMNHPHTGEKFMLRDYWVEVTCGESIDPRELFIKYFTNIFCPSPIQFAFEYIPANMKRQYFPKGPICVIQADKCKVSINFVSNIYGES